MKCKYCGEEIKKAVFTIFGFCSVDCQNNYVEMREYSLLRYDELNDEAKKAAYDRFSRDFVNNKHNSKTDEEILSALSKCWFDKNGATFLGTY